MTEDRRGNVLSEDPKDLEGASEWAQGEIKRMEREREAAKELTIELRPYIERARQKRKLRLANSAAT